MKFYFCQNDRNAFHFGLYFCSGFVNINYGFSDYHPEFKYDGKYCRMKNGPNQLKPNFSRSSKIF